MDDEEMVRLALAGDRRAFERLGVRMHHQLRIFFRARFPNEVADELAQQTAIELLEKFLERTRFEAQSLATRRFATITRARAVPSGISNIAAIDSHAR